MGRALDKHRIAHKYRDDLDLMMGEASDTAATVTSALSEVFSKGGGLLAQQLASKEAKKREQELKNAQENLKKAQEHVAYVNTVEKDLNGPKHTQAMEALKIAQTEVNRVMESMVKSGMQTPAMQMQPVVLKPAGRPWWVYGLAGVGVLGAGLIGYKLLRRK